MSEWTWEWPKKAGYYWFHGHKWGTQLCDERLPSTHLVLCRIDATGSPFYVTDGHFLYKAEGARGMWMPAEVPEPPDVLGGI